MNWQHKESEFIYNLIMDADDLLQITSENITDLLWNLGGGVSIDGTIGVDMKFVRSYVFPEVLTKLLRTCLDDESYEADDTSNFAFYIGNLFELCYTAITACQISAFAPQLEKVALDSYSNAKSTIETLETLNSLAESYGIPKDVARDIKVRALDEAICDLLSNYAKSPDKAIPIIKSLIVKTKIRPSNIISKKIANLTNY
jgi:hypothetical protein